MSAASVLVLGNNDAHPARLVGELRRRGVDPLLVDPADLPNARVNLYLRDRSQGGGRITARDGRSFAVDEITAVLSWGGPFHVNVDGMSTQARMLSEDEWSSFVRNLCLLTPQARWVNPITNAVFGELKLYQLRLAQNLGLSIPETVVSNSPDEVRSFVTAHPGGVASKRLTNRIRPADGRQSPFRLLTARVDEAQLDRVDPKSITYAPCLLQEYVPKDVEIRAYVIDDVVLTAEILSQDDPETQVDWRNYPLKRTADGVDLDPARWKCRAGDLPVGIRHALVSLVRRLGFAYSAVDLIRRPDGKYIFLEANDMGAFGWIEELSGLPVAERLVDLLIRPASADSIEDLPVASLSAR
jgi:glutathione synthase/RimK-type ligase-like ATP-grasp enzyme